MNATAYTITTRLMSVLVAVVLISTACKQPESVIISKEAQTVDTTITDSADTGSAVFRKVVIGETSPIHSLDPLLAQTNSELRAVQLVYEGLVRYDKQATIKPALARSWNISEDSLTYTFTLHDKIYYHDSQVFTAGTGRILVARDVVQAFERMALNTVPDRAARLFMSIDGFEAYFNEQRKLYNAKLRHLSSIPGIKAPNDSTVIFRLAERDPHFLQKLATPYAVIYPREATPQVTDQSAFTPVGTGPFTYKRNQGDSLHILANNVSYRQHAGTNAVLDRVDIQYYQNERALFDAVLEDNVQIIPEIPSQVASLVMDSTQTLLNHYADKFSLIRNAGSSTYEFQYNEQQKTTHRLQDVRTYFDSSIIDSIAHKLPLTALTVDPDSGTSDTGTAPDTVLVTYTDVPYIQHLLRTAAKQNQLDNIRFRMTPFRVPDRHTLLTIHYPFEYAPGSYQSNSADPVILELTGSRISLIQPHIKNYPVNGISWWTNLIQTTTTNNP